ncbi:MAG: hypothetical protein R6U10_06720 [Thermoplasmatota archaeon]
MLLRIAAAFLAAMAIFFMVFLAMFIFAAVFFVVAAVLLAVYMLAVKKPEVEWHGDWTLDRIREKKD